MKVVILVLSSLILSTYADEKAADPVVDVDQLTAKSLYDTIFADYYNPPKEQPSNKKNSKNRSGSNKNHGFQSEGGNYGYENKNKQSNSYEKKHKFVTEGYESYLQQREDYKAEYNRLVGRKGLGYDKRTATSYGLRAPITPELLEVIGQKYQKKDDHYNKNDDEKLYTIFI